METNAEGGTEEVFPIFVEDDRAEGSPADSSLEEPAPPPEVASVACSCGQTLRVRHDVFGKTIRCPDCGSRMTVSLKSQGGHAEIQIQFVEQKPAKRVKTGSFMFVTCQCGEQLTLRYQPGQMTGCIKCGRGVSLFFQEGGEAVPVFVDGGARPV